MRTDTQVAAAAVDKDVVALEVAVDDGRLMPVQVQQPAKDLLAPALDDLPSDHLEGRQGSISIQCSCAKVECQDAGISTVDATGDTG